MPIINTNIDSLIKGIRDAHYGMFKDRGLQSSMELIGNEIQKNTVASVRGSRGSRGSSQLSQTGRLYKLLRDDDQVEPHMSEGRSLSMKVGYARIDDFNSGTRRGPQQAKFSMPNGEEKTFRLRPEPELPSWIIMEFGRKAGNGAKATGIPKEFRVSYSSRDKDKQYMFGPSLSKHYKKPVMMMITKKWAQEMSKDTPLKRHPGIEGQRFFRNGLRKTIPFIERNVGGYIQDALMRQLSRGGVK